MDTATIIPSHEPSAISRLSAALETELVARGAALRPVVFACIGTDRSTGDSLGPLVGQKLSRLGLGDEAVVGTLEEPLHALNMAERLQPLVSSPSRPLVIAVDAALGRLASVGTVAVRGGGIRPGQGVGKDLPEIGELSVIGTVNIQSAGLDAQVLQSTRLYLVQQMADLIATSCWWALRTARREQAPPLRVVRAA
jgi:putative sporulation protein YyaC